MSLKTRIERLLKVKNYSDKYIGEQIGKTPTTVRNIKKGHTLPNYEFIRFIFGEYEKLNPDWFFFGKGEMFSLQNQYELNLGKRVSILEKERLESIESIEKLAKVVVELSIEIAKLKG